MIVVEGPDGAGKTRLAQAISARLGVEIAEKAVTPDAKAQVSIKRYVENSMDLGFRRIVYDRHALISSPIYTSGLTKIKPNEGFDDMIWLSTAYQRWRDLAPLVIVCLPPFEVVWANCQRDEDNKRLFPSKNKLASVYWLYFNLAARNPAMVMYDYTRHHADLVVDYCENALEARDV